jgi:ABC-type polysaccharide/polyol phosphate export permease
MQEIKEIWTSISQWRIWLTIGFEDVIGRYRRTALGPLWIVISQCAFIFGFYLVRRSLSGEQISNYLVFLSISLPAWSLIASSFTDGSSALVRSKGYIESYPLPLPIYIIRSVFSSLVNFLHVLVVLVAVILITQAPVTLNLLMFLPALLIILTFAFGVCLAFSVLGARFRDVGPAMASFTLFMFVVGPVFWVPTPAQAESLVVRYNPFYYLLEVMREPIMSANITPHIWVTAMLVSLGAVLFGLVTYKFLRPSVVYWL